MKKYISILLILIMCGGSDEAILTIEDTTTTTVQDTTTTTLEEVRVVSVDEEYTLYYEYPAKNVYPTCRNPNQGECYVLTLCEDINDTLIKADWQHIGEASATLSDDGTGFGVTDFTTFQPKDFGESNYKISIISGPQIENAFPGPTVKISHVS